MPQSVQLFDLHDTLLHEISRHVSLHDKQNNVQRTCKRLRRLLQHPVAGTWGAIKLRITDDTPLRPPQLTTMLQWMILCQTGDFQLLPAGQHHV